MPYSIVKEDDGYRVKSKSGHYLSGRPLTLHQAKKQKIAVILSELRQQGRLPARGGAVGGESYSLSDFDIQKVLDGVSLFKYPELHKMSSIEEAFDKTGRAMMLYLTEDENTGHWVCMIKKGDTIEYFDPYGGYKPDGERKWIPKEKLEELGEAEPTLSRMLKGYKVISNPHKYQKEEVGNNTCGRHCCCRLMFYHMSLPEYNKMITSSGMPADDFVTLLITQILHK